MSHCKILLADDSRTIRTILRPVLERAGYTVLLAEDGLEAVELAKQDCPDLVLLDIRMPNMDGYEVCQELQGMGEPWSKCPIIFFTNVSSNALELLGVQLGAYLPKPVGEEELLSTIATLLPRRPSQETFSKRQTSISTTASAGQESSSLHSSRRAPHEPPL